MRTAWALQGLGFLILMVALILVLEKRPTEKTSLEPTLITSVTTMPMNDTSIVVRSPAFSDGRPIPEKYTCDGENMSPPLAFDNIPAKAVSLVLVVEDPDVPKNLREDGMWNHWIVFNIPPNTSRIGEGERPKGVTGVNTNKTFSYVGPCPPDREHRYFFKVFALDTSLRLPEGATKEEVLTAIQGHILSTGQLIGTYTRP
jgi:Raf kinase inhibitor-like YbhB/YbcL family protein